MASTKKVLSLLVWSGDETKPDGGQRGKGLSTTPAPALPKAVAKTTRGGGAKANIPIFGLNTNGHTEDHQGLVLFECADPLLHADYIADTADAVKRFAAQSTLEVETVHTLLLDVPERLTGPELNLCMVKPGSYANMMIPFVVLYPEHEHLFTRELVTHGDTQRWWKADIGVEDGDNTVDELGVYHPTTSSYPSHDPSRLPFKFECQHGHVKQDGRVAQREFSMLPGRHPTAVQYASHAGKKCAVPEGKFHLYRFYMRLPPAEDFSLAEECSICMESSLEMVAVAPCRHVNVCVSCYTKMRASKSEHAVRCALCRCESNHVGQGAGNFVKLS